MQIDTARPNAGRIYDYLLGGHHNFESDRLAAEQLAQLAPQIPKWMRLNRWFLNYAVDELASANFNDYIDLATGLPTQGYIHERVPATARIIYNDIDPTTVEYARQVLTGWSNIHYAEADIRQIDQILERASSFFGPSRRVGICMVGVAYFIEDEAVAHVLRRLYEWAAPGSRLAISYISVETPVDGTDSVMQMYRRIGTPLYPRTLQQIERLTAPWQPCGPGLRKLATYIEEAHAIPIQVEQSAPGESMVGGIFEKPLPT
jgi:O-methyltransferase involved in polyketide biosynthesis